MTKMEKLNIEEMKNIYGGATVCPSLIEDINGCLILVFGVWTDDKDYHYCSFDTEERAEICAEFYTSWEKHTENFKKVLGIETV